MNEQNFDRIKNLLDSINKVIQIEFVSNGDGKSVIMENDLKTISRHVPSLKLSTAIDITQPESFFKITETIRFKARLHEKFLDIFFNLIESVTLIYDGVDSECEKNFDPPVFMKLYISPLCPYCPSVIKDVSTIALTRCDVFLDIIDGTLFDLKAEKDKIIAAPTLICDDANRWSGTVTAQEIMDVLLTREPGDLSTQSLRAIIEAGNAQDLAVMMTKENKIYDHFYDLLIHEKWPVRLGAMVVAESIHEYNTTLSLVLMNELWTRIEHVPVMVQGDIVYLAGEIGDASFYEKLASMQSLDILPELNESIHDALDSLKKKRK